MERAALLLFSIVVSLTCAFRRKGNRASLEARLRILFQKNDASKKSISLIVITIPKYISYLESKFLPTMTWKNYGEEWEIDRIIPFCEFDLTDPEEQQRCMHYSNAQPMFRTTRVINGIEYIGNLNKNKY